MAVSYKKIKIIKKQISYDRGVTWQDTEPLEYCEPEVIDIYPSMEACMDADCDLEKYEYELIDTNIEEFPKLCTETEFIDCCHSGSSVDHTVSYHFPSGIIKHVTFSDYYGHVTPSVGFGALSWHDITYKAYDDVTMGMRAVDIGDYHDSKTYDAEYNYGITGDSGSSIDGREVIFEGSSDCYCAADAVWRCWVVDYCFTVDELMPWVGDSIKIIWKKHYTREHCSDEWQFDEDFGVQFYGVAEQWIRTYDVSRMAWKWTQQVASVDSAGTITWTNGSEPPYYEELAVPSGSVGRDFNDTTYAYPVSVNVHASYYGQIKEFRLEFGVKSLTTYNARLGMFSEYNSYNNEYRATGMTSSNIGGSLYIGESGGEIKITSTSEHYNYIRAINHSNGELLIGGMKFAMAQDGAQISLSESDNIKVYITFYRDINDVVHTLIPVTYNGSNVWIDTTDRIIIKPITSSGNYYSDSNWYETF